MKKKINLQCILLTFLTFTMGLSQFIIIGIINNLSTDFRVSINPSQSTMPAKPVQDGQATATNFVDQWLAQTD